MLAADLAVARDGFALDARIEVESGRCLALVGPSGSGKSTLLRAIAGLLRPDRGTVTVAGETWFDAATGTSLAVERRRAGLVFQDYALFPRMSAVRNVAYGAPGRRRARRRKAIVALERFGLAGRAAARPAELSGGERQRVALARALAS
jgi:molybdate transport system ATP-binding protein